MFEPLYDRQEFIAAELHQFVSLLKPLLQQPNDSELLINLFDKNLLSETLKGGTLGRPYKSGKKHFKAQNESVVGNYSFKLFHGNHDLDSCRRFGKSKGN